MVAGSEYLSEWNLIAFDNLDSRAKIEGRSFVGGETRIRDGKTEGKSDDKTGEIKETGEIKAAIPGAAITPRRFAASARS